MCRLSHMHVLTKSLMLYFKYVRIRYLKRFWKRTLKSFADPQCESRAVLWTISPFSQKTFWQVTGETNKVNDGWFKFPVAVSVSWFWSHHHDSLGLLYKTEPLLMLLASPFAFPTMTSLNICCAQSSAPLLIHHFIFLSHILENWTVE